MRQPSESPLSSQGTRPALPRILPPAVVMAGSLHSVHGLSSVTQQRGLWGKIALLLPLLLLIEVSLLALYPLFITMSSSNDALLQSWNTLFPWLLHLYWTHTPIAQRGLIAWLSRFSWLSPRSLIIDFSALALVGSLLALLVSQRIERKVVSRFALGVLLSLILLGSLLFGLTLLFMPTGGNQFMQPTLLDGFYGRMILLRFSPYGAIPASLQHGSLWQLLQVQGIAPIGHSNAGPVWLDICMLLTLLSGQSVAHLIFSFRLLGLLAHVANVLLLWHGLSRFKPNARVTGTLLYAWNPLVLLFSVAFPRPVAVLLCCLLLATLFLRCESPTLAWVLVVLSALMNSFYLLLLPVVFSLLWRQSRLLYLNRRLLWWLGMLCITVLVVGLAYAPYWHGWDMSGIGASLRQNFFPSTAINSMNATLRSLPLTPPAPLAWLFVPQHWALCILAIEALLLLLGLWLIDDIPTMLLFSCWVLLLGILLEPLYWPWYALPALGLALYSTNRRTIELAALLTLGALVCTWLWLFPTPNTGLVLATLVGPLLVWGWLLFFIATWHMTHKEELETETPPADRQHRLSMSNFSRPSWLSRPSRPGKL